MTDKEIQERAEHIRHLATVPDKFGHIDIYKAHEKEDELYAEFIKHVAQNDNSPFMQEMARAILKTKDLDFERWYA